MTDVQNLSAEERALRERQGSGARYDDAAAPHTNLALARQGTAYFARRLMELDDVDFDSPSLLPGWTRRHVIAHLGYNARAVARLVEWARTGIETPMYDSDSQRWDEIVLGATLPTHALRYLVEHAAIHLNVEWRDLTDDQWDRQVVTAQGRTVSVRETAWMRAKEVWVHAVDLDNGGSFLDFPPAMNDEIIRDVFRAWIRRGEEVSLRLAIADRDQGAGRASFGTDGPEISGTAADLARWLAGRGARRLTVTGNSALPSIPRWF